MIVRPARPRARRRHECRRSRPPRIARRRRTSRPSGSSSRAAPAGRPRRIVLASSTSPVRDRGARSASRASSSERNRLEAGTGGVRAVATGETEVLPVGLVFRSVGYKGVPMPGLPFDERAGVIPNDRGSRAGRAGAARPCPACYVVGWIKRGPSGVIGTNKPDAVETVGRACSRTSTQRSPADPDRGRSGRRARPPGRGAASEVVTLARLAGARLRSSGRRQRPAAPRARSSRDTGEMLAVIRRASRLKIYTGPATPARPASSAAAASPRTTRASRRTATWTSSTPPSAWCAPPRPSAFARRAARVDPARPLLASAATSPRPTRRRWRRRSRRRACRRSGSRSSSAPSTRPTRSCPPLRAFVLPGGHAEGRGAAPGPHHLPARRAAASSTSRHGARCPSSSSSTSTGSPTCSSRSRAWPTTGPASADVTW